MVLGTVSGMKALFCIKVVWTASICGMCRHAYYLKTEIQFLYKQIVTYYTQACVRPRQKVKLIHEATHPGSRDTVFRSSRRVCVRMAGVIAAGH